MAEGVHSYGPTCTFFEEDLDEPIPHGSGPPKVNAQFFYVSAVPIDDPLTPIPPSVQPENAAKQPQKPFSARDNAALEEAWEEFQDQYDAFQYNSDIRAADTSKGMISFPKFKDGVKSPTKISPGAEESAPFLRAAGSKIVSSQSSKRENSTSRTSPASVAVRDEEVDKVGKTAELDLASNSGASFDHSSMRLSTQEPIKDDREADDSKSEAESITRSNLMLDQNASNFENQDEPVDAGELQRADSNDLPTGVHQSKPKRRLSPFRQKVKGKDKPNYASASNSSSKSKTKDTQRDPKPILQSSDMSGRPFARAPSNRNISRVSANGYLSNPTFSDESESDDSDQSTSELKGRLRVKKRDKNPKKVFVPVGVSRLHLVEMPELTMKPIYWNPINDTASVIRATWFYKDSMLPIPADVANQLEIGYEYIEPYAESYQEELQACIDSGAAAELKVVHKLWPEEKKSSRPNTGTSNKPEDVPAVMNEIKPNSRPVSRANVAADPRKKAAKRLFETHSVIYIDRRNAQILRPSVLPSVQQNRKPLGSIRKGRQIGVAVVRGFDQNIWTKLNPGPKMDARMAHAKVGAFMSQSGDATTRGRRNSCTVCDQNANQPKVTDLVLVIHGIGQKLSERVDSYRFTHAINGFRREFNVELSSEVVKGYLREDTGIMVLPVNWRLTVNFDEGNKKGDPAEQRNNFQLQDITPDSLHGVRPLISDVMLDVPYYLSHHKEKMTSAVIREANRVYRLWCRNNPGFQEHGKVHIIAHSLGSVMALEILSQQPTKIPTNLDLTAPEPRESMFEFDTKNLFCCGSPSGFFLLLNGASLVPRKGRKKPGMELEDSTPGITGNAGTYGCLAVDNIYNICHRNDPIAYLMNACVDSDYAASLQQASIPSIRTGIFAKMGNSFRWASVSASDAYSHMAAANRPPMQHMPSTVELEIHNFTKEEIAEKRMQLLNENGQIDYFLESGGGPLEFQYLNMLSAHSSYWILQDFARFLVVEIGRKPGTLNTMPILRAVKKREYKRGNFSD